MRLVRARVNFDLSRALIPDAWVPFNSLKIWIEFKYERLPVFCYYCGRLTHQLKFCENPIDVCIDFGGKYALFGKWLRSNMNIKVSVHVKEGELKTKGGFTWGKVVQWRRRGIRAFGRGKENFGASASRSKIIGKNSQEQCA